MSLLEGILKWENGLLEIRDLRLRSICQAFRHYVDHVRLSFGLRKLQPVLAGHLEEMERPLAQAIVAVEQMEFKQFPFLKELNSRPPAMRIHLGQVFDRYASIMKIICDNPDPPELNWKFGSFWPGDQQIYHPNLYLIMSNQILQLGHNHGRIGDLKFVCAMHMTVWLLGMYESRPFHAQKDAELSVWGCISVLLGIDSSACRTEVEYVFG